MAEKLDATTVIANWRAAYERANGKQAPEVVRWDRGLYRIATTTSPIKTLKKLVEMTENLNTRPALEPRDDR